MFSNNPVSKIPSTMTSREIAELTGKRHSDVLRDIDNLLESLNEELVLDFESSTYKDVTGKGNRQYVLNNEASNLLLSRYNGLARVPHRLQEESALKAIEQVLLVTLIRQYKVGTFRIDGYDAKNNIAYEIDEPDHRHKRREDSDRQRIIENLLECTFVRIRL